MPVNVGVGATLLLELLLLLDDVFEDEILLEVLLDESLEEVVMLDVISEELLETVELVVLFGVIELDVEEDGSLQPIIMPNVIAPRSIVLMSVFFIIRSFLAIKRTIKMLFVS